MDLPRALKEAQGWVGEKKGVEGVGQGKEGEDDCITVFISDLALIDQIPQSLYGVKINIEISEGFSTHEK